jgi:hypothetical protein
VGGDRVGVEHRAQLVVAEQLDAPQLVGGAEAIEEVEERHPRGQGRGVGDRGQVVGLLRRVRRQHREAGLAHRHDVRVIAEDRQRVGRDRARRHVEHEGGQLAGDLVEVGDVEEEALGGGEAGGERPGLDRAVDRAGGAALGLHLLHPRHLLPQVGPTVGGPLVGQLAHRRGWGDGIDRDDLAGPVGHAGGRLVAVDDCALGRHSVGHCKRGARRRAWFPAPIAHGLRWPVARKKITGAVTLGGARA